MKISAGLIDAQNKTVAQINTPIWQESRTQALISQAIRIDDSEERICCRLGISLCSCLNKWNERFVNELASLNLDNSFLRREQEIAATIFVIYRAGGCQKYFEEIWATVRNQVLASHDIARLARLKLIFIDLDIFKGIESTSHCNHEQPL